MIENSKTVWELGEDGGKWFVEGATDVAEAGDAVRAWLTETLGHATAERREKEEQLNASTGELGRWWFATGHREGEMVNDTEPPKWLEGVRLS